MMIMITVRIVDRNWIGVINMIDEKKLIEEFREKVKGYDKDCGYWSKRGEHGNELLCAGKCSGIVQAIKIAENQPKVGEWIPCSERLPDESGTYIVNAIENNIIHVTFAKWMKRMKKWELTGSRSYWKVIAWQPLPEPYQPGKE